MREESRRERKFKWKGRNNETRERSEGITGRKADRKGRRGEEGKGRSKEKERDKKPLKIA